MLRFNSKGLLVPNINIASNINELESEFVHKINSDRRKHLFFKYLEYSNSLKNEVNDGSIVQWIDGSFASKKQDPADIDIVSFINHEVLENDPNKLDHYKYPSSLVNFEIDAYIVLVYPRGHKNYPLYIGDKLYWMDLFDKTRRNRNGIRNPKGFLELKF